MSEENSQAPSSHQQDASDPLPAQVYTVNSLPEFIDRICAIKDDRAKDRTQQSFLVFRGQANVNFKLQPSLARTTRGNKVNREVINHEREYIRMAKARLPEFFRSDMQPLEILALLQHYGIPTRLLDVSENALVALYMACKEQFEASAEVFVFATRNQVVSRASLKTYIDNDAFIQAIADSCNLLDNSGSRWPLEFFFKGAFDQPYFRSTRHWYSDTFFTEDENSQAAEVAWACRSPIFVYAPIHSIRQQIQYGRYLLFPNKISDDQKAFLNEIDSMPKNHECIIASITVPATAKKKILEDLKLCGIREDFLFCDDTEKICKYIKSIFQPK